MNDCTADIMLFTQWWRRQTYRQCAELNARGGDGRETDRRKSIHFRNESNGYLCTHWKGWPLISISSQIRKGHFVQGWGKHLCCLTVSRGYLRGLSGQVGGECDIMTQEEMFCNRQTLWLPSELLCWQWLLCLDLGQVLIHSFNCLWTFSGPISL